jgi:hypothetical protein
MPARRQIAPALLLAGLAGAPAWAQEPATPPRGQSGSGTFTDSGNGQNLSDKLETSEGVLRPRGDPDPGIGAKPPEPNPESTRVIKPPGTPGGDTSVRPK